MEDLVLSIDQCQHLQEFGLDMSDAKLCWRRQTMTWDGKEPNERYRRWRIEKNQALAVMNFESFETVPTYTLQEIINKLPSKILGADLTINVGEVSYTKLTLSRTFIFEEDENLLKAAYNMLCWVIVYGYLKVK